MKKTKKVFIFGIGNPEKVEPITSKLRKMDFDVVVGPSVSDHEFLYKKSQYYRESYDRKIGAFCSDVGRVFVLSQSKGMYMDVSVNIGDDFPKFYDSNMECDVTLFAEKPDLIASAILFSAIDNNPFFKKIYNLYEISFDFSINPRIVPISPFIITGFLFKKCGFIPSFSESVLHFKETKICVKGIPEIRNRNTIYKHGTGSGVFDSSTTPAQKAANSEKYWQQLEDDGNNRTSKNQFRRQINLIDGSSLIFWVKSVRELYDCSTDKEELKKLRIIYKKIDYKLHLSERLIGSKLYRFFSRKKAF